MFHHFARPVRHSAWALLAAVIATGCAEDDTSPADDDVPPVPDVVVSDPTPLDDGTWYGDVAHIVSESCGGCHDGSGVAPYDLSDPELFAQLAPLIERAITHRTMPPWQHDNSGECNTWKDARWLEDDEIDTITSWLSGLRPLGDPTHGPTERSAAATLDHVSATVTMAAPYTPPAGADSYRCFVLEPPQISTPQFVTGFDIHPGNRELVHHVVLYDILDAENEAWVEEQDRNEEGEGYSCFGGPGTDRFNLIAAWGPGYGATAFPEGTGLNLPSNRRFVMQVHYSGSDGVSSDHSTIDLQIEESVEHQALMALVFDTTMVLDHGFDDISASYERSPAVDFNSPIPVTLHGVIPHMHTRGRSMTIDHYNEGEDSGSCVADIPRYDFSWQHPGFLDTPLVVDPNDRFRLNCHYDTSSDDRPVTWGDATEDEMCVAAFYVTLGVHPDAVEPGATSRTVTRPRQVYGVGDAFDLRTSALTQHDGIAVPLGGSASGTTVRALSEECDGEPCVVAARVGAAGMLTNHLNLTGLGPNDVAVGKNGELAFVAGPELVCDGSPRWCVEQEGVYLRRGYGDERIWGADEGQRPTAVAAGKVALAGAGQPSRVVDSYRGRVLSCTDDCIVESLAIDGAKTVTAAAVTGKTVFQIGGLCDEIVSTGDDTTDIVVVRHYDPSVGPGGGGCSTNTDAPSIVRFSATGPLELGAIDSAYGLTVIGGSFQGTLEIDSPSGELVLESRSGGDAFLAVWSVNGIDAISLRNSGQAGVRDVVLATSDGEIAEIFWVGAYDSPLSVEGQTILHQGGGDLAIGAAVFEEGELSLHSVYNAGATGTDLRPWIGYSHDSARMLVVEWSANGDFHSGALTHDVVRQIYEVRRLVSTE